MTYPYPPKMNQSINQSLMKSIINEVNQSINQSLMKSINELQEDPGRSRERFFQAHIES
jgi:hypothetical protein